MSTTGEKIRRYRRAAKLTQKQLAKAVGLQIMSISDYELDKYRPKPDKLQQIAETLGVSVEDLADTEENGEITIEPSLKELRKAAEGLTYEQRARFIVYLQALQDLEKDED